LGLVEAVDLVDEKNRLPSHLEPLLRFGHDFAHSWNPFGNGREGDEIAIGVLGDQSAESRFAGAGRAPEHHGLYRAGFDRGAERLPFCEEMLLTNELIEAFWAHARRQRLRGFPGAPQAFLARGGVRRRVAEFLGHVLGGALRKRRPESGRPAF